MKAHSYRIFVTAALAMLALAGCKKYTQPISDHPFEMEVKNIQSGIAWMDIVPENNDFRYNLDFVSVKEYNEVYKSDAAVVASMDEYMREVWKEYSSSCTMEEFLEMYLLRGAWYYALKPLEPDTEYYAFAYPYNGENPMTDKVTRVGFKTPSIEPSDIKFTVEMDGSLILIHPSNNDYYFFTFEDKEYVDNYYECSPEAFYKAVVGAYQEYGFMEEQVSAGDNGDDIADWYEMTAGRQFYLMISGYDSGINTPISVYLITWKGTGIPAEIVQITNQNR